MSDEKRVFLLISVVMLVPSGGGGGYSIFSACVGSDPASTVHQKKKYQKFQTTQKNI